MGVDVWLCNVDVLYFGSNKFRFWGVELWVNLIFFFVLEGGLIYLFLEGFYEVVFDMFLFFRWERCGLERWCDMLRLYSKVGF